MKRYYDVYNSPIGDIYIVCSEKGLCRIELFHEGWASYSEKNSKDLHKSGDGNSLCRETTAQLEEYFLGKRKEFNLSLDIDGTEFQKKAWGVLRSIPYGETRSYKEQAVSIGNPKGVRAVGQANRVNRVPIIIPCHRVIGKNGSLVGYAGTKTDIKKYLLNLEKSFK